MVAKIIRITDDLGARGTTYAKSLGISFNALAILAISEYLESRMEQKPALPEEFRLEPSPVGEIGGGKPDFVGYGRKERREMERLAKKRGV